MAGATATRGPAPGAADRLGYHHGSLREALVLAGLELSREAGADAIVLREATRRSGVTARAFYRHFADREALVRAVADGALAKMAEWMARRQRGASNGADLLRGVGEGYIGFALDEPGWFDVAVLAMPDLLGGAVEIRSLDRSPCGLLLDALGRLVAEGVLAPDRIVEAAVSCWSGVHGFAVLATRGPLRGSPRPVLRTEARRLVRSLVVAVTADPPRGARRSALLRRQTISPSVEFRDDPNDDAGRPGARSGRAAR